MGRLVAHQDEHFEVLAAGDVVERLDQPGQPSVRALDRLPRRSLRQECLRVRHSRGRPAGKITTKLSFISFLLLGLESTRKTKKQKETSSEFHGPLCGISDQRPT